MFKLFLSRNNTKSFFQEKRFSYFQFYLFSGKKVLGYKFCPYPFFSFSGFQEKRFSGNLIKHFAVYLLSDFQEKRFAVCQKETDFGISHFNKCLLLSVYHSKATSGKPLFRKKGFQEKALFSIFINQKGFQVYLFSGF